MMSEEKENNKEEKRQAKEQKRKEKIQKQNDKAAQYERDIAQMKKEIQENRNKGRANKTNPGPGNQKKKPSKASIVILILVIGALVFFVGNQMASTANSMITDELSTSDFIQAVEQDRVQNVVYDSGGYNVSGSYIPNNSIGSEAASAYNDAIKALNEGTLNILNDVQTQVPQEKSAPVRKYTATFVGQDSLLELMQKHPNIQYEIQLPSG